MRQISDRFMRSPIRTESRMRWASLGGESPAGVTPLTGGPPILAEAE